MLFHTFLRRVLETTFTDEEAVAGVGRSAGNEVRALLTLLSGQVPNPNNVFCRDVNARGQTVNNKTCVTQVTDALGCAYAQLKGAYGDVANWRWGRVHTVELPLHRARLSADRPRLPARARTRVPAARGRWTWALRPAGARPTSRSPIARAGTSAGLAAMDGTAANTFMQLPGVESEEAFPTNQPTMLTQWVLNQYFNFPFQSSEVTSTRSETFSP